MSQIFINHRTDDTGLGPALANFLKHTYGDNQVFVDIANIFPGDSLRKTIHPAMKKSKVVIALIGPNWDGDHYLRRLDDQKDWVRRELEFAKKKKKLICPLLMGRKTLPDPSRLPKSLRDIFSDILTASVSIDPKKWPYELSGVLVAIEKHTGLSRKSMVGRDSAHVRTKISELFCFLDRNTEFSRVKTAHRNGIRLYSGSGSEDSGFEFFIRRCNKKIFNNDRHHFLNWQTFVAVSADQRRRELCEQISAILMKDLAVDGLSDTQLIEKLQHRLQNDHRCEAIAFYTIRRGGSFFGRTRRCIEDWWETWDLLLENTEKPQVNAFLFYIPGWRACFPPLFASRMGKAVEHIGNFPKLKPHHLIDWWRAHNQELNDLHGPVSQSELKRVFRLCGSNHFDHIHERYMLTHAGQSRNS